MSPRWLDSDGVRIVTGAEFDRLDEQQREAYEQKVSELRNEAREEYRRSFGSAYRAMFPFKANEQELHIQACKELGIFL